MTIDVRPFRESDISAANHLISYAFGMFMGMPEPEQLWADRDYGGTRWRADPSAAFTAELDGDVVGAIYLARWGSVGKFGPLVVHPDYWNRGIGQRLLEPAMALLDSWSLKHTCILTFAHSTLHSALYQKYDFWPRFLTAIMSKPVSPDRAAAPWTPLSALSEAEQAESIEACRALTDSVYAGLDLGLEIRAVRDQGLGDVVLLRDEGKLVGFAVCHLGPGTEAGTDTCYIKFGTVQRGAGAERKFAWLLDACEALAAERGMHKLDAGINLARHDAYRMMLERGFRTEVQCVAMHRHDAGDYAQPDMYQIEDWR